MKLVEVNEVDVMVLNGTEMSTESHEVDETTTIKMLTIVLHQITAGTMIVIDVAVIIGIMTAIKTIGIMTILRYAPFLSHNI